MTIKAFRASEQKDFDTMSQAYFKHLLKDKMALPKVARGVKKPKRTPVETKAAKRAALEEMAAMEGARLRSIGLRRGRWPS